MLLFIMLATLETLLILTITLQRKKLIYGAMKIFFQLLMKVTKHFRKMSQKLKRKIKMTKEVKMTKPTIEFLYKTKFII